MLLSKKEQTQQWLSDNSSLQLKCLHCNEELLHDAQGLYCLNGHRFDIAKQGYFFLSKTSSDSHYEKDLFQLRRRIILESDFYGQLHQRFDAFLYEHPIHTILDAGCGEGSHLYRISQYPLNDVRNLCLVGVDLSKEGIQLATDYNGRGLYMVADLADLPFKDNQFDLVLSILSPANYHEFKRVIKPGGFLLKIVPNANYLGEIRRALANMGFQDKSDYSNEEVINVFKRQFPNTLVEQIVDTVSLSQEEKLAIAKMTPLTWHLNQDQLRALVKELPDAITLDLTLLIAKNF